MDDTNREITSSNESEGIICFFFVFSNISFLENPYTSTPLSDLASSSGRTMRDYDKV